MLARRLIGTLGIGFVVLIASACGGDDDERVSELEAELASLQEQLAAAEAEATRVGTEASTSSDAPTVTPAAANAVVAMTDFGFTLAIPAGLEVTAAGVEHDSEASATAGEISATDSQVAMVLVWTSSEATAEEAVAGAFELVRAASADLTFSPTNQGPLTLMDTDGAFGAFQAEHDGVDAGMGILGGLAL